MVEHVSELIIRGDQPHPTNRQAHTGGDFVMRAPFDTTDTNCPFTAALSTDAPRFTHENPDDALSAISLSINRSTIDQAHLCLCEDTDDIIDEAERFGMRIGCTRGKAEQLIDIALTQQGLPRLFYVLHTRAFMPRELLRILAGAITPFLHADDEDPDLDVDTILHEMEPELLAALLPKVDGQKIYGPYALLALLQEVLERFHALLRPPDPDTDTRPVEALQFSDDGHSKGYVTGVMGRDKAWEIKSAIQAVKDKENCTEVDALLMLVRAQTTAEVSLNLYCSLNGGRLWSVHTGWLNDIAAKGWLDRVNNIRIISDSTTEGYRPTEAQVAFVRGRDGRCMFPGCSIDAERCQIDHIEPYNLANPAAGGPTDTENLQALCQRHHNLKTDKLFDVIRYSDGRTVWSSGADGTSATTYPAGPANGPGRVSVSARLRRRSARVRDYNEQRMGGADPPKEEGPPPWEEPPQQDRKALPPGKSAGPPDPDQNEGA